MGNSCSRSEDRMPALVSIKTLIYKEYDCLVSAKYCCLSPDIGILESSHFKLAPILS